MARVRQKGTSPEIEVRSVLHRRGYRFRLHRRDLPGTPDIVLPGRRIAIFVNGCFWHRHEGCARTTMPKRNGEYWSAKFRRNCERDQANCAKLEAMGWAVFVVWECETGNVEWLKRFVAEYGQRRSGT
jgi:DNA mismatch endonuclease (patch repair protein)